MHTMHAWTRRRIHERSLGCENRTARAFVHIGIDYASPIAIRITPGHKSQKTHITLFVCLTTKALHLEFISDYTSPTFIAAYQRFVSRRRLLMSMYSDNETMFHGADHRPMHMRKQFTILTSETDSLQTEPRGISYPLRTSAICGRLTLKELKELSII